MGPKNWNILFVQKLVNLLYFPKMKSEGCGMRSVRVLGHYRAKRLVASTCAKSVCVPNKRKNTETTPVRVFQLTVASLCPLNIVLLPELRFRNMSMLQVSILP